MAQVEIQVVYYVWARHNVGQDRQVKEEMSSPRAAALLRGFVCLFDNLFCVFLTFCIIAPNLLEFLFACQLTLTDILQDRQS